MPGADSDVFYPEHDEDTHHHHHHQTHHDHENGFAPPIHEDLEHGKAKPVEKQNALEAAKFEAEPEPQEKQSCSEQWHDYPKCVMFIFGNEFCERFSYYGMKAVLTLYLRNILLFSQNTATILYSAFGMLCYFSPILGSILADGYIGKFHTIMWVSLFYAAGNVTLAVAASLGSVVHPWLDFIGLIIIGLGTGGIKPCVQPFGGDQFKKGQERQLAQFFSIFYFAINAGSTISILITPIFRTTPCEGQSTCYPLAFGVPAALMVIAVMFFAFGGYWYKKMPPKGNVFSQVAGTVGVALKNKRMFETKREHWLDHYLDSHNCDSDDECRDAGKCLKASFVDDIKAVLRVLVVFVPLPIFWALYEQQGSTWVIQATEMNSEIATGVYFLPDQMGVLNAVLIMVLIPIFTLGVYPLFGKCFNVTALRKMCVGCFLAGVAYLVCMGAQLAIRPTLPTLPASGQTIMNVSNYVQTCSDIRFVASDGQTNRVNQVLKANETAMFQLPPLSLTFDVEQGTSNCDWVTKNQGHLTQPNVTLVPNTAGYVIFTDAITDLRFDQALTAKSQSGEAVFSMNINYYVDNSTGLLPDQLTVAICKVDDNGNANCDTKNEAKYKEFEIVDRTSAYADVAEGKWELFLVQNDGSLAPLNLTFENHKLGGIFTLTVFNDPTDPTGQRLMYNILRQAPDNTVSILWQVPQYFVISVAEILFSITGYEFAYSQAPLSMKSVVFALYLLTDAVGNVIILIITSATDFGADLTWMFLIYACLMFLITVVFIFIAIRYKYTLYVQEHEPNKK